MRSFIAVVLGVVLVAVYASAADPESVNAPEPGTASEPAEQPYHQEQQNSDGTFTRTGIFSDDLLFHDHFQTNGDIIRTFSSRISGSSTPQIMASSSTIDGEDEQFRAGMLERGFIQEPNGVWWKHQPGIVYSKEKDGGSKTPKGLWYRIYHRNIAGRLFTRFLASGPYETTYSGFLVPGTTSLDEATLFTLMGYTGTPSGMWYKIVPREVSGEWVNECTVVGPHGGAYTGNLPLDTTSPDEATLFKIVGYTETPTGIWYKCHLPREVLDEGMNVCFMVGPDGGVHTGKLPLGTTSPDEATLFKIMGYTETPSGIKYKIVFRKVFGMWVNKCTVVGPDGEVYSTDNLPLSTTSPDEATLFEIMGYTRTPSGIWYKCPAFPHEGLDGWVNVCTVVSSDGRVYTGTLPSGTTSPDEATLLKIIGMTETTG